MNVQSREHALVAKARRLIQARFSISEWEDRSGMSHHHFYSSKKNGPTIRTLNRMLEPVGYELAIVPIQYDLDTVERKPYNGRRASTIRGSK